MPEKWKYIKRWSTKCSRTYFCVNSIWSTSIKKHLKTKTKSYQQQWVPGPQRQLWEHVFQLQFHWKKCWRNHHHHLWFCHLAFVHQVEFHVPNNIIPNMHFQFDNQLGQHEQRYTHAKIEKTKKLKLFLWETKPPS